MSKEFASESLKILKESPLGTMLEGEPKQKDVAHKYLYDVICQSELQY